MGEVKVKSRLTLCSPVGCTLHGILQARILENPLLPGIFPIQELNQGLLHCRWIFYQLSYQGIKAAEKEERFQCISKIRCEFQ